MTAASRRRWLKATCLLALAAPLMSSSSSAATLTDKDVGILIFIGVFVTLMILFLIPTFVAFGRGHPNRWAILLVNMFFGATGFGWLGCLLWACDAFHRPELEVFEGPVGPRLELEDYRPSPSRELPRPPLASTDGPMPIDDLVRLKSLLDQGALSPAEYDSLKRRLIGL